MREQATSLPKQRTAASRVLTAVKSDQGPVVTYSIIGVTALMYLLQWIPSLGITNTLLFSPVYMSGLAFEPWRAVTSILLHSTSFIFHILLNMYTLWIFGKLLEPMLGKGRYLVLYLVCGISGSIGVVLLDSANSAVLGASGAIFGLMGAFVAIHRRLGSDIKQLYILIGINLVIGFLPGLNIAWQAHVGGLVGGVLMGLIYVGTRQRSQRGLQSFLIAAFVALLVAAGIVVANWKVGIPLF